MALILSIETATSNCSAVVARDGSILSVRSSEEGNVHAERLAVFIQECLEEAQVAAGQLDAIAVSIGPGSYTGLRVGLSTAKGLAYGLGIPVLPVSTLFSLSKACAKVHPGGAAYFSAIDARRMEVYLFAHRMSEDRGPAPVILDETPWTSWLEQEEGPVFVCGDGAPKVISLWPQARIRETAIRCSAIYLVDLAEEAFQKGDWQDLAYIEPLYLKPPNVTVPKSMKILRQGE